MQLFFGNIARLLSPFSMLYSNKSRNGKNIAAIEKLLYFIVLALCQLIYTKPSLYAQTISKQSWEKKGICICTLRFGHTQFTPNELIAPKIKESMFSKQKYHIHGQAIDITPRRLLLKNPKFSTYMKPKKRSLIYLKNIEVLHTIYQFGKNLITSEFRVYLNKNIFFLYNTSIFIYNLSCN